MEYDSAEGGEDILLDGIGKSPHWLNVCNQGLRSRGDSRILDSRPSRSCPENCNDSQEPKKLHCSLDTETCADLL